MPGRLASSVVVLLLPCVLAVAPAAVAAPPFRATVLPIRAEVRDWITGRSWRPGCPVALDDLRLVTATHWGFDARVHRGSLVVHRDVAAGVVLVLQRLYDARFPIRRMRLVDAYGAHDGRSIEADNTSGFNCRAAAAGGWSQHAYGRAIDVNPLENPYVHGGRVDHRRSVPYVDRRTRGPGVIVAGGVVTQAFAAIGWGWGGRWPGGVRDYQHFSASGH